jgi:hypothetical protein
MPCRAQDAERDVSHADHDGGGFEVTGYRHHEAAYNRQSNHGRGEPEDPFPLYLNVILHLPGPTEDLGE